MTVFNQEVSHALYGAWRLARLDPGGLAFFDRSPQGALRSFWAPVLGYPLYLLLLVTFHVDDAIWERAGIFRVLAVKSVLYVLAAAAYPLAMLQVARFLDRAAQWEGFVVAYNWSQLLLTAAFLFCTSVAASGMLPGTLGRDLVIAALVASLLYEWYVARVALQIGGAAAVLAVLVELVLDTFVGRIADALL